MERARPTDRWPARSLIRAAGEPIPGFWENMFATNVGLKQRGLIREGYFADITIFNPETVIDRATFEEPNQYPLGINFVIVNGRVEVDNGQRTPAEAGRVLRGPGYCTKDPLTLCAPNVNVVNPQ